MSDTVYVVTAEREPVYVDDNMEKCRNVAGNITASHGKNTTIHKEVTCNLNTDTERFECTADYDDWIDIAESEFVDYVEGRRTVGFVFNHEEIGLHGLKFDPLTCVLEAVAFESKKSQTEQGGSCQ